MHSKKTLLFIDLFAGLGGIRLGLECACKQLNLNSQCVFTSEIKKDAVRTYQKNFPNSEVSDDIRKISSEEIPDFDILLAGFPCQAFSRAGTRQGFSDTRGTLFFEVERILRDKQPANFILENVEGLVTNDRGKTLRTILCKLKDLGYKVTWEVLNALDFGVPQDRKRIYIVGTRSHPIFLDTLPKSKPVFLSHILETGKPTLKTEFIDKLCDRYSLNEIVGKSIKDKRGGKNNIHSWDIELKGEINETQKQFLNILLKERRKKKWAELKGIKWMDGMPLTLAEIASFFAPNHLFEFKNLKELLDDLVEKRYLAFEHPKDEVEVFNKNNQKVKKRLARMDLPKGYNLVTGKLSFEISKVLEPNSFAPTLVATDMERLAIVDGDGLRKLTIREGLRLFGFPESYQIDLSPKKAFDLLGNTVVVSVIEKIVHRLYSLE
ncbi:DNA (cytosine-5-)-methyltransferase [Spirulina sp. 06S082]|uniref:DNA (cytosine-5-)-methyltransferase n=1 Tax=Spirulina sp. 06S082 TaxID=3110248 RepID=UPI002B1F35FA|nr:DNA (cytosine-5-)-methyltransferase [Spirulina sp. 06S082]MEA5468864.1 DNA (cytosine-5-)-methyltransferase [Spirulina sp. 06S082]